MSDRIAALAAEFARAKTGALEFIDAMPDALLGWKPAPEVFSFAGQMIHIASTNFRFAARIGAVEIPEYAQTLDADKNAALETTKPALLAFVSGSYDLLIEAIKTLTPELLDEDIQVHKWSMSRGTLIAKAMEHHAHHRGQTVVYFRVNGLTPPSERLF